MNPGVLLRELWQSWRASLRRPGFVLLAGLTLALGIGLCTATFVLLDGVVLKSLPYPASKQLVVAGPVDATAPWIELPARRVAALRGLQVVQSIGFSAGWSHAVNLAAGGEPLMADALPVDRGYLATLGVRMALGRNFTAAESTAHGPAAVILGHGLWQRLYAGRPDALGKTLDVDGVPSTIVGVLPASFRMPMRVGLLVPISLHGAETSDTYVTALARLRPGVTRAAASAAVDVRINAWMHRHGDMSEQPEHFSVRSLASNIVSQYRQVVDLVFFCALALLMLAGVNITNLVMLRAIGQSHAYATRQALGATGPRTALPLLAECVLILAVGISVGWGVAMLVLRWINVHLIEHTFWFGTVTQVAPTPRSLGFGLLAGLLAMVLAMTIAFWRMRGEAAIRVLVTGTRAGQGPAAGRVSRVLVVVQAMLATLLLVVALSFVGREHKLYGVRFGFDTAHVLDLSFSPPVALYPGGRELRVLDASLLARLRALPGVEAADSMSNSPVGNGFWQPFVDAKGNKDWAAYVAVGPDLFHALGLALLQGRMPTAGEGSAVQGTVVVNAAFAHKYLRGHALGATLSVAVPGQAAQSLQVVGVAANLWRNMPGGPSPPVVYMPWAQMPEALVKTMRHANPQSVIVRVQGDPAAYAKVARAVFHDVAPQVALIHAWPLSRRLDEIYAPNRALSVITSSIALAALLLAAVGLYAVVSVAVAARRHEWGVRAAMGAAPIALGRRVLRSGLLQVATGVGLGALLSVASLRVVAAIHTGPTYGSGIELLGLLAGSAALVLLAGLVACLPPAWRAARTSPTVSLNESAG